ncbi:hypothetical protein JD844_013507 [Phrynosoma platyrhinos]|uniref:Uncharacterized protein n=1 Tax=Phrynosoma platyrhinos TaxID=52577 RepID=A0ABQ7TLR7_PHRPL|nr:hypothetical protein JD844_013507 [Phrynosoma platyrhinos]
MPKRKTVCRLQKLCLENVANNMDRAWVKDYRRNHLGKYHSQCSSLCGREAQDGWAPSCSLRVNKVQDQTHKSAVCKMRIGKCGGEGGCLAEGNLTSLSLNGCNQIPAVALTDVVKALPRLTKLKLVATQCNTQVLSTIGSYCPKLNELDITNCKRLTPDSLLHLAYDPITGAYCCQSLQRLTTDGLMPSTNYLSLLWYLVFVLLALPSLKYLGHHATEQAVRLIHDQNFSRTRMPVGFPSLEEVARYRTSTHPNEESSRFTLALKQIYDVVDSTLPKVRAVCPHLLELSVILRDCHGLDQHLLAWHSLVHLIICGRGKDLRELLPVTACLGTQLEQLSLEGFTFKDGLTFHTLLSHCPNLLLFEFFFLSPVMYGFDRQSENEAINWDLSLPPLHFPELTGFFIMYTDIGNPLPSWHVAVVNNILVSVFKYSPLLKTLTLLCLPFSLDEAFQKVLNPPSTALLHLHELSLLQAQISVNTINLLLSTENQLSILSLEKCLNINNTDYTELLRRVNNENFELVIKWK